MFRLEKTSKIAKSNPTRPSCAHGQRIMESFRLEKSSEILKPNPTHPYRAHKPEGLVVAQEPVAV